MLLDTISNRYSVKLYLDKEVEEEKVKYVLDCALKAPSKQAIYPYEIFVLGNSEEAKLIKEWLFWEETWCLDGKLATLLKTDETDNPLKDMNAQYLAPILMIWVTRQPDPAHQSLSHSKTIRLAQYNEQKVIDMTVSASFSMLAAEEQGLNTCFARCHNESTLAKSLGRPGQRAELALGFGYAEPHNEGKTIEGPQGISILKDGKQFGRTTKNLDTTFDEKKHYARKFKPNMDRLIKYI